MSLLKIEWRPQRKALLIAGDMNKANPGLLFPLHGIAPGELDELIRAILAKRGITDEHTIHAIIEKAEKDAEVRLKVSQARAKIRKIMAEKRKGNKIMMNGHQNWVPVFFPALKRFVKGTE
jgi:hypothetical protein